MKKTLASLLVITLCLTLVGCNSKEKKNKKSLVKPSIENVSMIIKEGTLTRTSATIIITDTNSNPYDYGQPFEIERKKDGKWQKLETREGGFDLPAYRVDENNQLEMTQNWKLMYGKLEDGEYRLVKYVCVSDGCKETKDFYAEFVINDETVISSDIVLNEINNVVKNKIIDTKKIEVYKELQDGDKKLKTITEEKEVTKIVELLYHVKEHIPIYPEAGIGSAAYFMLYDSNDKLLATIHIGKGYIELDEKEYLRDTTSLLELFEE